jgi:hypothetical protein
MIDPTLVSVTVTLGPAAANSAQATAAQLEKLGLREPVVLEALGIVTGKVAREQLAALSALPGLTVEPDLPVFLEPPD